MKTESIKCGEIIRYAPGKFTFSCVYCSESFTSKSAALAHFESHFIVKFDELGLNYVENECQEDAKRVEHSRDDGKPVAMAMDQIKEEEAIEINTENTIFLNQTEENICDIPESVNTKTWLVDTSNCTDQTKNIPATLGRLKLVKKRKLIYSERNKKRVIPLPWGPECKRNAFVTCDICGNRLRKHNLNAHFQSHLNKKRFVCKICKRGFNMAEQLKRHEYTHSATKRYSCDYCGWLFHDRTNLVVHIRKHTGEKPYKCKSCDKSFAQSTSLNIHTRTHTGERPYKCDLCDRTFTSHTLRKRHKTRHFNDKPFECKLCENKSFTSSKGLRDHERAQHTGERPYVCNVCNSSYARRNNYLQHIVLHTGEKKHKCRVCDIRFAQLAGRRSHEKSVHKDVAHLLVNT